MSVASAAAPCGSAVTTVWPMMLDLSKDDCRRSLRSIELQAYAGVVSAFRAQGDLTKDKKKTLQELQRQLSISTERHRAEVRRAVNDEKLTTIADHVSGPSVTCDWLIEGRRLVPLMPRLVPQTAFSVAANQSSSLQMEKNAQMPSPGLTVTHSIGSCVVKDDEDLLPVPVAAASSDRRWQTQPQGSTAVHHGSGALSAGGSSDGTDRATSAGCSAASVVTVGSSSSSVLSKAPVVTTKVVAPAGVQTPMKVTVTKPQMAAGSTQKLILVNASHSHATASPGAGSNSTSAKSLTSQAVMLTKPAGATGSAAASQPKTSVVYPASQAHSPGGAGIVVGTSPGAAATGSQLQHSLTIARPRPKAVAGPAGASTSAGGVIMQQQQVSVTATSAASRLRMPGPSSASPATSVVQAKVTQGGAGTALITAGPQPVSPAAGTRPSVVTSAIAITTKPGIQIKQEGAMKIITSSSTSKQLLPKTGGSQTPIVVVTSTAAPAASAAAATGTTGSTVGPTVVRSITTGGQVHVTASGKVIGVTTAGKAAPVGGGSSAAAQSAVAASAAAAAASGAAAAAAAPSSLVSVSGKPGASIIAHQGTAVTAAAATVAKAPASPALTVPRTAVATVAAPSAVKSCTVIVQNPPQRQPTASAPAAGGSVVATVSSAAALAASTVTSRLQRGGGETASSSAAAAAAQSTTQGAEAEQQAAVGTATGSTATVVLSSGRSSVGEASAARSVAAAAGGGVVPPTGPPVELSLMARPSILAGLMQSDTSAALVASPASSTHIILDHVSAASDGLSTTGAVTAGDEVWLLTSDGSGIAEQASAAAAASQTIAEVVVEDSVSSLCHSDMPVGVAEHVTVSSSSVEVSGGGQSDEPVGSQAPQFDIFSSALAEAQIDLDPYEYSDEVSTSGGADDPSASWTATAAEPELITVVDALVSLDASDGSASNCIVSDGSSSLLSGTDACVTVAEYQEVSDEFVQAISQCGAVAGDGVAVAVIEGGAAAAASALGDDTAVLTSVCLAAPVDAASDLGGAAAAAAAAAAPTVEPVVVQLGDGVETGVVTSVTGDADGAASSCSELLTPSVAAIRPPEVVVVVSGTLGQAADSVTDVQDVPATSSLAAGDDDLVSEDTIASTTSLLPPLHAVSAIAEQVTIAHLPEAATLSQLSSASVPSLSPDVTSPVSGILPDGGDALASSAAVVRLAAVSSTAAGQTTGDAIGGSVFTLPSPVVGGMAAETAASIGSIAGLGSSGIVDLTYGVAQRKRKTLDATATWDDGSLGSWTKAALSLMHKVMKFRGANRSKGEHNASAWFLRPVSDDEAPGYSAVVRTPMDFGTIKRKLEAGTYAAAAAVGIEEFHADVTLVRANCSLYNPPEHCVRRDCDEVMAYYEREFERTFGRMPPPPSLADAGSGNASSSCSGLTETGVEASATSPKRCKISDDSNGGTAT